MVILLQLSGKFFFNKNFILNTTFFGSKVRIHEERTQFTGYVIVKLKGLYINISVL